MLISLAAPRLRTILGRSVDGTNAVKFFNLTNLCSPRARGRDVTGLLPSFVFSNQFFACFFRLF
jgi:hypothetical protein